MPFGSLSPSTSAAATPASKSSKPTKYCFLYGSMVHPLARRRRLGQSSLPQHEEDARIIPAVLPDHRLAFGGVGGTATIEANQVGWEVHGILIPCTCSQDLELLTKLHHHHEAMAATDGDQLYESRVVQVFAYDNSNGMDQAMDDDDDDDDNEVEGAPSVQLSPVSIPAHAFFLSNFDDQKQCCLPEEWYLQLIAQGMEHYGIDHDYIQDQILGVEYLPTTTQEECLHFRTSEKVQEQLSFKSYVKDQKKLYKAKQRRIVGRHPFKKDTTTAESGRPVFRIGSHVIQVGDDFDPWNHPFCRWIQERLCFNAETEGDVDATWVILQTMVDPDEHEDICDVKSPDQITPLHHAWAHHQMVAKFQQAHKTACIVAVIEDVPSSRKSLGESYTSLELSVRTAPSALKYNAVDDEEEEDESMEEGDRDPLRLLRKSDTGPPRNLYLNKRRSLRHSFRSSLRKLFPSLSNKHLLPEGPSPAQQEHVLSAMSSPMMLEEQARMDSSLMMLQQHPDISTSSPMTTTKTNGTMTTTTTTTTKTGRPIKVKKILSSSENSGSSSSSGKKAKTPVTSDDSCSYSNHEDEEDKEEVFVQHAQ